MTHLSRVWNHTSFNEQMGPVVCSNRGSPTGSLLLWGRHVGASLPSPTFPEGGSRLAEGTVLSLDPLRVSLARMSQPLRTVFTFFPYQEKLVISHIIRGHEKVKKNYSYP
jgi:hypothetical protein